MMNLTGKVKKSDLKYPDGKEFILTIFDDTDVSTLNYIKPIYEFLSALNMKITKSVWPLSYEGECDYKGSHTLEDEEYAKYIKALSDRGFEIGFHGPRMVSSVREDIIRSFEIYYNVLGYYPRIFASHAENRENLYWGESRFTFPFFRKVYAILSHDAPGYYQGHVEGSPFFWGDLSLQHIDYVRSFTYNEINLLNISNAFPYSNERQPWVKSWFLTSDANNVEEFNLLLNEKNQAKLERERGVCIISTHFGKGFLKDGKIHKETKKLLLQISKRNGWFVPVSTGLDFLKLQQKDNSVKSIKSNKLFKLELSWFIYSFLRRKRSMGYDKTEVAYLTNPL